jgi:hypothetical protein
MWKVSPKTPHTQFLCCFQLYKLLLKTNRALKKMESFQKYLLSKEGKDKKNKKEKN